MMLKLLLLLSLVLFVSVFSAPSAKTCRKILDDAGNSRDFGYFVGHALHSISLRTLQKFKPDVTEDNKVPTVNLELTSDEPILPYAPNRSSPDSQYFHTEGMKILDEILTHMDDTTYEIKGYTTLEKIAHTFHMEELWAAALIAYQKLLKNPPSEEVCRCALDIENNGVLKQLRYSALLMREPTLVFGTKLQARKESEKQKIASNVGGAASGIGYEAIYSGYRKHGDEQNIASNVGAAASGIGYDAVQSGYRKHGDEQNIASNIGAAASGIGYDAVQSGYRKHGQEEQKPYKSQFEGQEIGEPQFEDDELLQKESDASTHLTNQEAWKKWKMVGKHDMRKAYDTATYLYCALN